VLEQTKGQKCVATGRKDPGTTAALKLGWVGWMGAVPFKGSCTSSCRCCLCSPCTESSCRVATAWVTSSGLSDWKVIWQQQRAEFLHTSEPKWLVIWGTDGYSEHEWEERE